MSNAGRIAALRDALGWYSNENNYDDEHAPGVSDFLGFTYDEGRRAREAIRTDNVAADADMERIRSAAAQVADLMTRTHEPISNDCQEAEDEIRKLTTQLKIATDVLEWLAAGGDVPTPKTAADDALIQMSVVE